MSIAAERGEGWAIKKQISQKKASRDRCLKNRILKQGKKPIKKQNSLDAFHTTAPRGDDDAVFKEDARKVAAKIRKQKARKKLRIAAESGDADAIKKHKDQKEANRIRSMKYRKRKQAKKQMKQHRTFRRLVVSTKKGANEDLCHQKI